MALITDPDNLNDTVELSIDTSTRKITLNITGNLDSAGVTGQALYSKLKELWRTSATYIKFPFPMESITPEQFEFIQNWEPADDATRKLLRTCGWAERKADGSLKREYAGIITLGTLTGSPYYLQAAGGTPSSFSYLNNNAINEAVQIYGDSSNGNFTKKDFMKIFSREQGKTFDQTTLAAIGVSTLTYIAYRFPLANATDLKISTADVTLSGTAPYTGIDVTYFAVDQSIDIGGTSYPYDVIIYANNATGEQVYEKVQYLLRQDADIDEGSVTVIGKTADSLLRFVGNDLITSTGVYLSGFDPNDTNRITFTDVNGVARQYPYVAAGTLLFNTNLVNDASAVYRMFFTTLTGSDNDFGEANAVVVKDSNNADIAGSVSGTASIPFTFSYDSNTQGGRAAGTDASVTVVAIGLQTGQYVAAESTLKRAIGQNISLAAALERNYTNP